MEKDTKLSIIPNLEYHRSRAKSLLKDLKTRQSYAVWDFCHFHPDGKNCDEAGLTNREFALHDAQVIIARRHGFATWARFKEWLLSRGPIPADLKFIGVISERLKETRDFYTSFFGYSIQVETDSSLVLVSPTGSKLLGFLCPNRNSAHSIEGQVFSGDGIYLTFGTDDVERDLDLFRSKGVSIETGPIYRSGEALFMVRDPNGIGIYISEPKRPTQK
jgi:catechol 2,3-dioxygenase-like lactoylglutathione lyase family enzyme